MNKRDVESVVILIFRFSALFSASLRYSGERCELIAG